MNVSIEKDVQNALLALERKELVVFPTETVYGLGADALDALAVARIFEAKNRPYFNPLIIHLGSKEWLSSYVETVPPLAERLAGAFWPGPLTMVLPKKECVPDLVTAGSPYVAVRVPRHPLALDLIQRYGKPLAAPSANRFTQLSPTRVEHAKAQLGDKVSVYLDGGPCSVGVESTVLGFDSRGGAVLLREGGVTREELLPFTGPLELTTLERALSPGQLEHHYAPSLPLYLAGEEPLSLEPATLGVLAWKPLDKEVAYKEKYILSPSGDLVEAASTLFQGLYTLQTSGVSHILAYPPPNEGLGRAINDRLRRARTKK